MFGFIAPPCGRCTGESLPAWRGSFCGLARCLAHDYGAPARLLVNRDAAFLALLGLSLDPEPLRWAKATCCNPLATPFPVADDHPAIRHAAAVSVCGLATKLDDDATDEGPLRRTASRLAGMLISPAADRAIARLNTTGFPTARVLETLHGQDALETRSPLDADRPTAEAFGHITAHLTRLSAIPGGPEPLRRLGASFGSLVYWRDAWDDRERDRRKHRFNPYLLVSPGEIQCRARRAWRGFTEALGRLPLVRHGSLLASLQSTTARRHGGFLGIQNAGSGRGQRRKRRQEWDRHGCFDWCDCCFCWDCPCPTCGHAGGADACCDCGPGDSGCCDCNPCDGCDCCSCH